MLTAHKIKTKAAFPHCFSPTKLLALRSPRRIKDKGQGESQGRHCSRHKDKGETKAFCCSSPSSLYKPQLIPESRARVMRSPRLAAIGVATLSGLIPIFLDPMMTPIMIMPTAKKEEENRMKARRAQHVSKRCMENVHDASPTQNKGSNESSSHAAGTEQDSVVKAEVPIWNPSKYHCCNRGQEANHGRLNLKRKAK